MNIETTTINRTNETTTQKSSTVKNEGDVKFSDELKNVKESSKTEKSVQNNSEKAEKDANGANKDKSKDANSALDGLQSVVKEFNQSEDKKGLGLKNKLNFADNQNEGKNLINNDFNIQENKEILPQMSPNMNLGGDNQAFSSFMNNTEQYQEDKLKASAKDLAEEAAILSTMADNIAMANRNNIENQQEKTVNRNDGIKKVDINTGIVKETIVKYDSVIMDKSDVEFFADLVNNKEMIFDNARTEQTGKSANISKTLADMLAKSMENNRPLRIDFDNNISVIIKITRDGKVSADFLPSSQVAEAYLRENLPLLKQRFDEQNLPYDELNQRERRNKEQDNNRKKGREDE